MAENPEPPEPPEEVIVWGKKLPKISDSDLCTAIQNASNVLLGAQNVVEGMIDSKFTMMYVEVLTGANPYNVNSTASEIVMLLGVHAGLKHLTTTMMQDPPRWDAWNATRLRPRVQLRPEAYNGSMLSHQIKPYWQILLKLFAIGSDILEYGECTQAAHITGDYMQAQIWYSAFLSRIKDLQRLKSTVDFLQAAQAA